MKSQRAFMFCRSAILIGMTLTTVLATASGVQAQALEDVQTPDKPLVLKAQGSFFVGGDKVEQTQAELGEQAGVHDVSAEMFQNTAIVWSRITLHAVVGGNEVATEFTVTEVYQREGSDWKLLELTFSSVRNTHKIQK